MRTVGLPALDGRFALGYLAALGTLQLLDTAGITARLSWSADSATAQVHSDAISTIDDVVGVIKQIVADMPDDVLMPFGLADFPPTATGKTQRMQLAPDEFRDLIDRANEGPRPELNEAWVTSLATDLALTDGGLTSATLFSAISGQQTLRTMLEKPLELVRQNPDYICQAFGQWQRVDGVSGEYLDHRVLFDAADSPTGESNERGVPGATWLALMASPLIRTTSTDGTRPLSTGWFLNGRKARLRWGLWSDPLDLPAIKALWEHPLLTQAARTPVSLSIGASVAGDRRQQGQRKQIDDANHVLREMGVFLVCRAERRKVPGRNFAGVLAPVTDP